MPELLRRHSHAAAAKVKLEGGKNDLVDRIAEDRAFPITREEIEKELDPRLYIGRSVSQVDEFLRDFVQPLLDRLYHGEIKSELNV